MRSTLASSALVLALSLSVACSDYGTGPVIGPPATAKVAFCTGLQPQWVAFRNADGTWTQAQPTVAGAFTTFTHEFTTDLAAVATAQTSSSGPATLSIYYGTPGELGIVGDTNPAHCNTSPLGRIDGTVAGLGANEQALVSTGHFAHRENAFPAQGGTFELRDVTTGPQDILALRATPAGAEFAVTGIVLRRGVDVPAGATIPVVDFGSAEAFQPVTRTVTLAGLGGDGAIVETDFRTVRSEHVLSLFAPSTAAAVRSYAAIPDAQLQADDLHRLTAATTFSGNAARSAAVYFRSATDRTLTLGPAPGVPELSVVSSTPSLRLRARLATQTEYDRFTSVGYQQGLNTIVTVGMTAAYAAAAGGYDLVVPELTGTAGFDPQWALRPGAQVLWTVSRIGGTLGLGANAVPREGDVSRSATNQGVLAP